MKTAKNSILTGSLILTGASIISRIAGFFYRIFLSNAIGSEGLGLYQLVFPIAGVCLALCSMGISTSVSRFTAAQTDSVCAIAIRRSGIFLSLALSGILCTFVYCLAEPISVYFLQESRCAPLVRLLALCIPFSSLHGVISGSFYGQKKTLVPAVSQLIEQFLRITIVFFLWQRKQLHNQPLTPLDAMVGLLLSELCAVLFLLFMLRLEPKDTTYHRKQLRTALFLILPMAIPLTATRFCLDLFHSMEHVLIPIQLQAFGISHSEALSLFGILNGMSMPFILFPSTITNSLAIMLLPTISQYDSTQSSAQLTSTCSQSIHLTLLIGILFAGLFITYGHSLGVFFFSSPTAGNYIQTLAWLCPFLYLTATLGSILNGLGETNALFFHNLISAALRIAMIFFAVPRVGIIGYFWGLLISYLVCVVLHYIRIARTLALPFDGANWIVKPVLAIAGANLTCWAFQTIYDYFQIDFLLPLLCIGGLLMSATFVFLLHLMNGTPIRSE